MKKLSFGARMNFLWTVAFNDVSELMQFNEIETENKYQLVLDRINEVDKFFLYNEDLSIIFAVDLGKGIITKNKEILYNKETEKHNIKLIFKRRHQVLIGGMEEYHNIRYLLGFQYDALGSTKQIIFYINQNGEIIVGEE